MNKKEKVVDPVKEAREYEKFQAKVRRLTAYGHDKRIFSRMEYQKRKEAEEKKAEKINKKRAAGKKETVA